MKFWIEFVDSKGLHRKRRFRDQTEFAHFVANPPKGVAQIVSASEDYPEVRSKRSQSAQPINEPKNQQLNLWEPSQKHPMAINSKPIEQAWAHPKNHLSEHFDSAEEAAEFLIERYKSGWAISTLARKFHMRGKLIKELLVDNSIPLRRRRFRELQDAKPGWEEAFSKPTPEALYWAGFLMADGSIIRRKGEPTIQCRLVLSDIEHIRSLCDFVGRGTPLFAQGKDQSPLVGWQVISQPMADDLARWGIVPGKGKLDDVAPKAEARISAEFWRGMIDGDGSIGMSGRSPQVQLTARRGISEAFIEFIEANIPLRLVRRRDATTGRPVRKIRIHKYPKGGGTKVILNGPNAVALCQLLYVNAPRELCLSRKRDAAIEIIGHYLGRNAVKEDQV